MVDMLTRQQLVEAGQDAATLDAFANGGLGEPNLNRVGQDVQNLATIKARALEVAAGVARLRTYASVVAMLADPSQDEGTVGRVLAGDGAGDYVWSGSQWIWADVQPLSKSQFDALSESVNASVRRVEGLVGTADATGILNVVDVDDAVVLRVASDGGLHVPGLERSVQDEIGAAAEPAERLAQAIEVDAPQSALFEFTDAEGEVVLRVASDGGFHVPGLERSVQDELAARDISVGRNLAGFGTLRSSSDLFFREVLDILVSRSGTVEGYAPPAFGLLPQVREVGTDWISNVAVTELGVGQLLDTPYRENDQVVHPHIIEFYNGFRGYRYLMCATPYKASAAREENPVIYGSHDLSSFEMLDGFRQPLADPPPIEGGSPGAWSHNSDNFFTFDPRTGALTCVWRQSKFLDGSSSTNDRILDACMGRSTRDGYAWSDPFEVFPESPRSYDSILSPAILMDPVTGIWHWYTCRSDNLRHRTAPSPTGPWSEAEFIDVPSPVRAWHVDVRYVGGRIVALINDRVASNLYLGISTDWTNWQFSTLPVLPEGTAGVYKSTFVPEFVGDQIRLAVVWTERPEAGGRLYVSRTNFTPY